jgi:hypothetical protein
MALDQSFVGRTYPPTPAYEVGREKIREFADAIGDPNPAYRDPEAAKALGHPTCSPRRPSRSSSPCRPRTRWSTTRRWGSTGPAWCTGTSASPTSGRCARGDRVVAVVTVESIKTFAGNDMITLVTEMSTVEGELISTAKALLVARAEAAGERDAQSGEQAS